MTIVRRPEWSLLVSTSRLIYRRKLALKRSLNYILATNPSTPILGISHVRMHVCYVSVGTFFCCWEVVSIANKGLGDVSS
jgi:hypothetical protein